MAESVQRCIMDPLKTPFMTMFITFFTETLAFFLAVLVTMFFGFHIWLMSRAMTTIEFCEKSLPRNCQGDTSRGHEPSVYDLGVCGNVRACLGKNPAFWLLSCARPAGDGLNFMSDETKLTRDLEAGRGIRRRTHQRTQRTLRPPPGSDFARPGGNYYPSDVRGSGYGGGYGETRRA